MAVSYDIDSKQISDSIASKHGIAALLNSSADSEQRLLTAYESQKRRADDWEQKYYEKCEEVEQLKKTIEAMQNVQPITKNFHIGHDYVAAQYVENK